MIIAVDFDGILCEDAFPEIGKPNYPVISTVRQLIDAGHDVILWTSRVEDKLQQAVDWCEDYGLHFCAVNGNSPNNIKKYGTDPRKIYADVYIDDHNVFFWSEIFEAQNTQCRHESVQTVINKVVNDVNKYILNK